MRIKNSVYVRALNRLPYADKVDVNQPHIIVTTSQQRQFCSVAIEGNIATKCKTINNELRLFKLKGDRVVDGRRNRVARSPFKFVNIG